MNKKGFTIVELVIVIAVIAVLAAVLIPTFTSVVDKANESAILQKVQNAYISALAEALGSDLKYKTFEADGFEFTFSDSDGLNATITGPNGFSAEVVNGVVVLGPASGGNAGGGNAGGGNEGGGNAGGETGGESGGGNGGADAPEGTPLKIGDLSVEDGAYHLPTGTYYLEDDTDINVPVVTDGEVTINLKGKTLTLGTGKADQNWTRSPITVSGTLTITGSENSAVKIATNDDSYAGIYVQSVGTLNLTDIAVNDNLARMGIKNEGDAYFTNVNFTVDNGRGLVNTGDVEISGGEFSGGKASAHLIHSTGGTMKIDGTTFSGTCSVNAIQLDTTGTLDLKNVNMTTTSANVASTSDTPVEISGGSFAGTISGQFEISDGTFADVVLNGESSISVGTFNGKLTFGQGSETKITGGTFTGGLECGGDSVIAKVIIEDGTFSGELKLKDNSDVTINGGTFNSQLKCETVDEHGDSKTTITGGDFKGGLRCVKANNVTIVDGTFDGLYCQNAHVIIDGGTFSGTVHFYHYSYVTINGGTFNSQLKCVKVNGAGNTIAITNEKGPEFSDGTTNPDGTTKPVSYKDITNAILAEGSNCVISGSAEAGWIISTPVAVTGVEVNSSIPLTVGGTETISVSVKPYNATDKSVIWTVTEGQAYVTVDENGKVTGIAPGTAIIYATTKDGGFSDYCTVTVSACEHTGGTATCTEKAKCSKCGTAYGDLASHTPAEDDGNCMTAIKCTVCNTVTTEAQDNHTGGTATCTEKATCSKCGTAYGDLAPHTPKADDGDCTTPVVCTECSAVITAAPAKEHNFTGEWQKNTTHHWHVCQNDGCDKSQDPAKHTAAADDGDCTIPDVCTVCSAEVTAALSHTDTDGDHKCDNYGCNVDNVSQHSYSNYQCECGRYQIEDKIENASRFTFDDKSSDGYSGNGLYLSNTEESVGVAPGTNSFTLSFWINIGDYTGDPVIVRNKDWNDSGESQGFVLALEKSGNNNIILINIGDGTNRADVRYTLTEADYNNNDNGWMHVLLVIDRGTKATPQFYINFQSVKRDSTTNKYNNTNNGRDGKGDPLSVLNSGFSLDSALYIGQTTYTNAQLNSNVDEFIYFNGALDNNDVAALKAYYDAISGGNVVLGDPDNDDDQAAEPADLKVLSQNLRYKDDVEERFWRFKELIDDYKPDLIGTQEGKFTDADGNINWIKLLEDNLDEYTIIGRPRSNVQDDEWNAILYKTARFDCLKSDTFWLTDDPGTPGTINGRPGNINFRICTWAVLYDKYTGETVIFANTHLEDDFEKSEVPNNVRKKQVEYLLQHLQDEDILGGNYDNCTIYLTGDFNCEFGTDPYNAIIEGGFVDSEVAADAADVNKSSTVTETFHNYGTEQGEKIDFCFYKGNETVLEYEIITTPYTAEGYTKEGYVSDHYGVIATFKK